jgi:GntR family transcriptional regulator
MLRVDIDPTHPTPLYEQIAAQVRSAVAAGSLLAGQALPSVRRLATALQVNPATVVRAYKSLELQGYVRVRRGAGTFVQAVAEGTRTLQGERAATELVREMFAKAVRLGVTGSELEKALARELGGGAEDLA